MPWVVFILLARVVGEAVRAFIRKTRGAKSAPLCANCLHAHMQYGANSRCAISCMFGGSVRPIKLDVLYCTDYQSRNSRVSPRAIGFVHEIAPPK